MAEELVSNYWSTKRVLKLISECEENGIDYKSVDNPFHENNPQLKIGNILWEYTQEELIEMEKCAADVVYFANKYCEVMTDEGIQKIALRDYQIQILREYQENRLNIFLAPRQCGKTITSSIFLLWYLIFNHDKTAMLMANIGDTAAELMDKIKTIMKGLPFFLKPGVLVYNVMTMKFDNGCRIMAKTTTKTSAIGFAVHFLYMDEFAHINENFIEAFFKSTYPTISSSKVSRIIITSTPNGENKFYKLYKAALDGENAFNPVRVDWWQVPGRDEAWKKTEIANLGSEESFNQEYGNQFLSSDKLLLDSKTLKRFKQNQKAFKHIELSPFDRSPVDYQKLVWHPSFDPTEAYTDPNLKIVISIDTSGGVGKDFSVFNIFKLVPMPLDVIKSKKFYETESDFFSLLQIGLYRSNIAQPEELKEILEIISTQVFDPEQCKIVLEMDFRGELLYEKCINGEKMFPEMFIYTKHTEASKTFKPGIKYSHKMKEKYCEDMKIAAKNYKIIPTELISITELSNFGMNSRGTYSSQLKNDDIAMTVVNLSALFEYTDFSDMVTEIYDTLPEKYRNEIEIKLNENNERFVQEGGTGATGNRSNSNRDLENFLLINSLFD